MKNVPLRSQRSPRGARTRTKRPIVTPGAQPPKIFVCVQGARSWEHSYIHARIQVRRSKYRYLVWYVEGKKKEFYLGQIKSVPLRSSSIAAPAPAAARARAPEISGVR